MSRLNYILIVLCAFLGFQSCNSNKKTKLEMGEVYECPMHCEGDKTYGEPGSCPVCKMDLIGVEKFSKRGEESGISETSIFNLNSTWHTEEDETIQLKELKGKILVVVMIYTACKSACPRLVADMRNIEARLPKKDIKEIQFVLVSIDPKTDSPARLKAFAKENQMDGNQWTLLQGTESSVREFANVLSVKYKEISPIDFSHSNIISVFSSSGELMHQQEGLGVDNEETLQTILELIREK